MPSATPSSQSSAKKQQSISTFFTKPASTSKLPAPLRARDTNVLIGKGASEDSEELFLSSEDEVLAQHGRRRHSNATNSSKSPPNPRNGLDLPPRKRLRLSDEHEEHDWNEDGVANAHDAGPDARKKASRGTATQTSRFAFSSFPAEQHSGDARDDAAKRDKAKLHDKFVRKLGKPDSIAEIKRRNWLISEDSQADQVEEDEAPEAEEEPQPAKKPTKASAAKNGGSKLTPMEKQYLDIKRKHLDTILVVEVGYKFKFFGEDARAAAKELGIVCIPGKMRYDEHPSEAHLDRFASASIPVHRLHVHVKRLVSAGHKVGVVRQLETAALKAAGDNRNTPFVRKLTNLYTKGTYIDDAQGIASELEAPVGGSTATGYLICLTESNAKGWGTDEKVHIGLVAVQPTTGDIIYDEFEDGFMRSEIETRLLHIAPCEILVVGELSKASSKLAHHLAGSKTNVFGDKVRLEWAEKPKTMAAQAHSHVSNFYVQKMRASSAEQDEKASKTLERVLNLAEPVIICLSAMITHLTEYGLEHVFDLTKYFQSFSARSHVLLNGTSLTSLEIYQNQTDHTGKGSLFWTLDRTKTRFGQRLLRKWVGRPLLMKHELEKRVSAVEELKEGQQTTKVDKISRLLSQIKTDLEKSLIRIYYGKCTRPELLTVLQSMQRIANAYGSVKASADAGFVSPIINDAIALLPTIAQDVISFLDKINPQAAADDDKYAFFREDSETDDITAHKLGIAGVESDLDSHRSVAAEKVRKKKVEYVTVAGIEYLIEIENSQLKNVPASWAKISGTKKLSRFHTPEVIRLVRERDQHKESLAAACDEAFSQLLADISSKYQVFRDCVQALAILDCLCSLAIVASLPGYVKPEYTDSICIEVEQGRHPMVEQLLLDAYVPNDIDLATDRTRALLITGPNMGGKSSYVRQIALIAIMGQIGSYVPAASAKLGMLDAVFTRMGAFDNMMTGESTFMVELNETSDILKQATSRSLIILDELGRGTSTHDGVAIAQAVLDYVVRDKKSLTLFITHYQNLSALAKSFNCTELKNVHMRFAETDNAKQEVTFLYEVGDGVAHRSYGLNVARLANVPESVLDIAATKSKDLENDARAKSIGRLSRSFKRLLVEDENGFEEILGQLEQL